MRKMERLRRTAAGIVAATVLCTMAACGNSGTPEGNAGGTGANAAGTENGSAQNGGATADNGTQSGGTKIINRGIIGAPGSLNPLVDAGGAQFIVLEMVYDRPFDASGSTGDILPRLCDSYEVNDEYTEYTLHINQDAKWQDGEDVTADDFVWTYGMYTDPAVGTSHAVKLSALKGVDDATGLRVEGEEFGVTAIDEDTVQMSLTRPMLPGNLFNVYLYIFPEHVYGAVDPSTLLESELWLTPVGSGYCTLDTYVDGSTYEFSANKNYYLGAPDFDKMVIKCMDSSNLLGALMSGEIDMTVGHANRGNIPITDVETARQQGNLELVSGGVTIQYLTINNQRYDENVRKAIDLAIDKEMIANQVFSGYAEVLDQIFPPSHPYYDSSLLGFTRDVEEAKRLLKEAGWDENQTLELLCDTSSTAIQQMAVIIQQNLEEAGIHTEITTMEQSAVYDACRPANGGDFDLALCSTGFGAEPSGMKNNVAVGSATNFSNSTDDTLYEMYDSSGLELDSEKRGEIYKEIQAYYLETMPQSFIVNSQSVFCYNTDVVKECNLDYAADIIWRMWEWKFEK